MDKLKNARLRFSFVSYLEANGLRSTPERNHVLNVVLTMRGRFSASDLLSACMADPDSFRVSRATVFNTLGLLEKSGVLRRVALDRHVSYEVIRQNMQLKARQQLVCSGCGKVQRLQAPMLSAWVERQSYRDFLPSGDTAVLTVNGLCNKCRRRNRLK